MEFLKQLGQLIAASIGSIVIAAFYLFESILFGVGVYYIWNMFDVGSFVGLGNIGYWQAVGILFVYKAITFKSTDMSQSPTQIIVPKDSLKEKE